MMQLTFMSTEALKKALGDLTGYEILDSLPMPEDFETLDIDKLEAAVRTKKEESR